MSRSIILQRLVVAQLTRFARKLFLLWLERQNSWTEYSIRSRRGRVGNHHQAAASRAHEAGDAPGAGGPRPKVTTTPWFTEKSTVLRLYLNPGASQSVFGLASCWLGFCSFLGLFYTVSFWPRDFVKRKVRSTGYKSGNRHKNRRDDSVWLGHTEKVG